MTAEDKQDLQDLQAELLGLDSSPWEPDCVCRAFATSEALFVLTMQGWIDLETAHSPFLLGTLPEADDDARLAHFVLAFEAFGHYRTTPQNCDDAELELVGLAFLRVVREAFAMRVQLAPPEKALQSTPDNGMGEWLPIIACLKSQLGFSMDEALAMPVGQAFALIAGHRVNQGWNVAGETYRLRSVEGGDRKEEEGSNHA